MRTRALLNPHPNVASFVAPFAKPPQPTLSPLALDSAPALLSTHTLRRPRLRRSYLLTSKEACDERYEHITTLEECQTIANSGLFKHRGDRNGLYRNMEPGAVYFDATYITDKGGGCRVADSRNAVSGGE